MLKAYLLSAILVSTAAMAQCTNEACNVMNSIYNECKYSNTGVQDFKSCLCNQTFLEDYQRCESGFVCPYPIDTCVKIYCPGTFDGGFDAPAFCSGSSSLTSAATTTADA
ncbi:hypothetical protein M408DRAFT_103426 [Serendipita vermifera MAFF 305830]|uniref:Extracellular membrane protein CFEM domain-containing protein n=1 Tax=Serendipita vermifera MAFF 305830 TaxID=933852 RepID=A0A0C3AA24_SERVB|nr:hypothetical protein M408DRAFT_103426 [Serendipita vermifera MAFF 305830]